MRTLIFFNLIFMIFISDIHGAFRGSSAPYISGDGFRDSCDHLYEETDRSLNPKNVLDGDTIFVKTDYLKEFFGSVHPNIHASYILVTHNSDSPSPQNFYPFLDEVKLIGWFAQNVEGFNHPKLHPIPIGLANKMWPHGNPEIVTQVTSIKDKVDRNIMLYMNFNENTNLQERRKVALMFKHKPYCVVSGAKPFKEYLFDLVQSKFVLSPRGNGLDCHRTWEALLMGAIPIVKTSSLDPMFENLPVLIVKDWSEITLEFLEQKYMEMSKKSYSMEKAYLQYWLDLIESYKLR